MKKNLIIVVVTVLSVFAIESAVYFGYWCNNLHKRYSLVVNQNRKMRNEIRNYEEILDSIDNVHHHDYLTTIRGYKELRGYKEIRPVYSSLQVVAKSRKN